MFWKDLFLDLIAFIGMIGCVAVFIFYCWLIVG